jgi:hypothetical protein
MAHLHSSNPHWARRVHATAYYHARGEIMKHIVTIFTALTTVGCIGPSRRLDMADVGSMPVQIVRQA